MTVFVGWQAGRVTIGGDPAERAGSAHAARAFCPDCGTPIAYRDIRLAGEIYLLAGTLDDPSWVRPRCHAWTEEAVGWLRIADELPRYSRFSRPREP